jgi:predicted amidohydrolase YtcJ
MAADIIVKNAKVLSMDKNNNIHSAFSIKGGRVEAVGLSDEEVAAAGPSTQVVDAGGKVVLPGFIDAHAHLELLAYGWEIAVDHRSPGVKSIDDLVARLKARADVTPKGEWILGQGNHYQEAYLTERRLPTRYDLDRASTEHPIVCRFSFHINIFNSKALEILGITRDTPDMNGGSLDRDPVTGDPTGKTNDMYHALGGPDWPVETVTNAMDVIQHNYLSHGVTGICEFSLLGSGMPALINLYQTDRLKMRVSVYPKVPDVAKVEAACDGTIAAGFKGIDPTRLRLGGMKLFIDGGLTSKAAALYEPYVGTSERGDLTMQPEVLNDIVRKLDAAGFQIAIHAIGDRGLDVVLDAYEGIGHVRLAETGPHRVEHAGNVFWNEKRAARFKALEALPIPQPAFIYTTAPGYAKNIGAERARNIMPFRTMLDQGFLLPGNSDAIGIDPRQHIPMFAVWCLVKREMANGERLDPKESISVEEALKMYTRHAAMSIGMGHEQGSIEPGKFADFIILDRDPRSVSVDDLAGIRVEETWVGGEQVYRHA